MFKEETKELKMSNEFRKKIEMICKFACVKPTITNGNINNVKGTNIAYVKPHIIKINNTQYLMFDECDDIFVNGYDKDYDDRDFDI